jgi:hypothetical protein
VRRGATYRFLDAHRSHRCAAMPAVPHTTATTATTATTTTTTTSGGGDLIHFVNQLPEGLGQGALLRRGEVNLRVDVRAQEVAYQRLHVQQALQDGVHKARIS